MFVYITDSEVSLHAFCMVDIELSSLLHGQHITYVRISPANTLIDAVCVIRKSSPASVIL